MIALHPIGAGLPDPPDDAVLPYVEAARRAIERFGWARTTMRDIATEAGVERTTVYRHVGSMPDVYRLLVAHEIRTLVDTIPDRIPAGADGPTMAVELLAAAVEYCWEHPVLTKVTTDEPELLAGFVIDGVPAVVERIAEHLTPMFALAGETGLLAVADPEAIAQWVARIGLSLLVAPPPGELRPFLDAVLRPALAPSEAP